MAIFSKLTKQTWMVLFAVLFSISSMSTSYAFWGNHHGHNHYDNDHDVHDDDDDDDDYGHKCKFKFKSDDCNKRETRFGKINVCKERTACDETRVIEKCIWPVFLDYYEKKGWQETSADGTCGNAPPPPAECGDSVVNNNEACDEGGVQTATCEANCSLPVCGDATLNELAGEQCDDGNTDNFDGCSDACTIEVAECGNGVPELGEICDDGAQTASCEADCTLPACGDGVLNELVGEQCDDGNLVNNDGCDSQCVLEAPPVNCPCWTIDELRSISTPNSECNINSPSTVFDQTYFSLSASGFTANVRLLFTFNPPYGIHGLDNTSATWNGTTGSCALYYRECTATGWQSVTGPSFTVNSSDDAYKCLEDLQTVYDEFKP